MRFLVAGGAGFVGSALSRALLAEAHEVVIYDNFSRGRRDLVPAGAGVTVEEGDIRDRHHIQRSIAKSRPEVVVHLAALHFIPDCIARPEEALEINVEGTRNVFAACTCASVRGVVFASSAAVYAPSDQACRELDSPVDPPDIYGETKLRGEMLAREFHLETGRDMTMLRIFNVIGPHETNPHVLPQVFECLRVSNTLMLGNMEARRDYVHARDVARAILTVAARSQGLATYNVGSGRTQSVTEIVELLRRKLARPVHVKVDPARLRRDDRPVLLADIEKIGRELGWAPEISMEDTIEELLRHYKLRQRLRPTRRTAKRRRLRAARPQ